MYFYLLNILINTNIYSKEKKWKCVSCSKDNKNKTIDNNNENNNSDDNAKDNEDDKKPPIDDNKKKAQQLYLEFSNLYEYVQQRKDKILKAEHDLDSYKKTIDSDKENINNLNNCINLLKKLKKEIDDNTTDEEKNKENDEDKKKEDDNEEFKSIYDEVPIINNEENYDITGITINFINQNKFVFKYSKDEHEEKKPLTDNDFKILDDLIKHFLAKKKLKGNFTIDWLDNDHVGINPILKIKISDKHNLICRAFIKYEKDFDECIPLMFNFFKIVDLLPFEYHIDIKNKFLITEDLNEKGYTFLDNGSNPISERNKDIWKNCTNINEFRYWCYILNCDDIDPMFKYDNCCFKDNKVYALDLRNIGFIGGSLVSDENVVESYKYNEFLIKNFLKINTNKMEGDFLNSEQYKTWKESINNFKDFTIEEKKSINTKLIKLISYIVGFFKNENIKLDIHNKCNDYFKRVSCNIMESLQFYIAKYKKKYGRFTYNEKLLDEYYQAARYSVNGYTYEKGNYILKNLINDNKLDFEYFLTTDTLVNLYEIYWRIQCFNNLGKNLISYNIKL